MTNQRKSLEPWIKDSVQYYPHQLDGVRRLFQVRGFILGDEMGLGKSLQAITLFAIDVSQGKVNTLLVVCPTTLKGNWADELDKFTGFYYMRLMGGPVQRKGQLAEFAEVVGPKVLVVNYEQVIPHLEELNTIAFDEVVFDEAHYLKNPKAKRTKACLRIKARRVMLLSGTPMLNKVNELWPLLHRINPQEFPNYHSFVRHFCVMGGWQGKQIVATKNVDELRSILDRYMLQRFKADVLDLPSVQIIERRVDMSDAQMKLYKQIKEDLKFQLQNGDISELDNPLTLSLRLRQVCGTTATLTDFDDSAKLDLAVSDDIEVLDNGHKIVVFSQFRKVMQCYITRMQAQAPRVPIFQLHGDIPIDSRQEVVKTWSDCKVPAVIVCNINVAGVGLNMTAARYATFLDKLFVPGLNQQAIDRLHRIGASTTQPVQVREYITRGSVENRVNQILHAKRNLQADLGLSAEASAEIRRAILDEIESD